MALPGVRRKNVMDSTFPTSTPSTRTVAPLASPETSGKYVFSRYFGPKVPAEDVFAGSFRAGQRGDGARGRRGSGKRGIHHVFAANPREGHGAEQKYRGGDARGPEVSRSEERRVGKECRGMWSREK